MASKTTTVNEVEEIPVLIVGAGPAGLTLGLSLAKFKIRVSNLHSLYTSL
jgi:ribulose 1,5-bisphosphate synthetase/thiazole synthase